VAKQDVEISTEGLAERIVRISSGRCRTPGRKSNAHTARAACRALRTGQKPATTVARAGATMDPRDSIATIRLAERSQTWASWRSLTHSPAGIAHQRHQITEEDAGLKIGNSAPIGRSGVGLDETGVEGCMQRARDESGSAAGIMQPWPCFLASFLVQPPLTQRPAAPGLPPRPGAS